MENITTTAELKETIEFLEAKKFAHLQEMKSNFSLVYESFKPANLIKNTMQEIGSSPYLFKNILTITMGLVAGYISKRALFFGKSGNKSRKLLGLLLQLGVTNLVVHAPKSIKSLVQNLFSKREKEFESD